MPSVWSHGSSQETYSVACIELFRRLWVELERIPVVHEATQPCARDLAPRLRAETLRLELALLLDACRSERWRLLLNISQRSSLQSIIEDVLEALNSSAEIVSPDAIAWAQNRLLDAILEHCAARTQYCIVELATAVIALRPRCGSISCQALDAG